MAVVSYTRPALEFNHNIAQNADLGRPGPQPAGGPGKEGARAPLRLRLGAVGGRGHADQVLGGDFGSSCRGGICSSPSARCCASRGRGWRCCWGWRCFPPPLVWLIQNDWLPLTYASSRASSQPTRAALKFAYPAAQPPAPAADCRHHRLAGAQQQPGGLALATPPCRAMC